MGDKGVYELLKRCKAIIACLDLVEMVITDHAIEEPSDEFSIALKVQLNLLLNFIEWDKKLNSGGSLFTGVEIVARRPVLLLLGNIFFDFHSMEEPVL